MIIKITAYYSKLAFYRKEAIALKVIIHVHVFKHYSSFIYAYPYVHRRLHVDNSAVNIEFKGLYWKTS